jgi:hypothetical protein
MKRNRREVALLRVNCCIVFQALSWTIRNNYIHDCWGEGIIGTFDGGIIQGSIFFWEGEREERRREERGRGI